MSRTITIITPENIPITYEVAGFASRFMALVADLIVQIVLLLGASLLTRLASGGGEFGGVTFNSLFSAAGSILAYAIVIAYPIFFEMLWGGRTPGKRLFGLRVVRDGGYPITLFASVTRNIVRFADFGIIILPGFQSFLVGLPGLLCIFFSSEYKRLGDYAAGTVVILEGGGSPLGRRPERLALTPNVAAFLPLVKNLDRLTPQEYRMLRRFTARRHEFDIVVQASLGERLARPLMQKLNIQVPIMYQAQFADLLEAIERRYAQERGVL